MPLGVAKSQLANMRLSCMAFYYFENFFVFMIMNWPPLPSPPAAAAAAAAGGGIVAISEEKLFLILSGGRGAGVPDYSDATWE